MPSHRLLWQSSITSYWLCDHMSFSGWSQRAGSVISLSYFVISSAALSLDFPAYCWLKCHFKLVSLSRCVNDSVSQHSRGGLILMCWLRLTWFDLACQPSTAGICISMTTGLPAWRYVFNFVAVKLLAVNTPCCSIIEEKPLTKSHNKLLTLKVPHCLII